MERAVTHLHTFAKEVGLTTEEWMSVWSRNRESRQPKTDPNPHRRKAIQFLTATGQICSNIRQEFILLSDILGLSALVDTLNHPVPAGSNATEIGRASCRERVS